MDLLDKESFDCCPAARRKLPRTESIPAGNTPFQGNDIVGVYRKLPGANFEAC